MITAGQKSKPSSARGDSPIARLSLGSDLLAGIRLDMRGLVSAAILLVVIDLFAGWTYLASYFAFFRVPVEGLGLSVPEILAQGLRTLLLPVTVVIVAAVAPFRRLRDAAIAVAAYLLFLALAALVNHWASPVSVLVQLAAGIVTAGVVFGLRMGVGGNTLQRLLIGAAGLLLLISIPVASGTLDAGQISGAKSTTLHLVTSSSVLPGGVPSAGQYTYTNYVLLRENDTRLWLFRIGDRYAYSIGKNEVLSIRY